MVEPARNVVLVNTRLLRALQRAQTVSQGSIPQQLVQHQTYAKRVQQTLIPWRQVMNKPTAYATVAILEPMVALVGNVQRVNFGWRCEFLHCVRPRTLANCVSDKHCGASR